MRTQIFYCLPIALICFASLSCKKTNTGIVSEDQTQTQKARDFFSLNPKIAEAKFFFENNIQTSPFQKFKKTPNGKGRGKLQCSMERKE